MHQKLLKIKAWILLELSSLKVRLLIRIKNTDDLLILKFLRKTLLLTKIGCQNELIVLKLSLLSLIYDQINQIKDNALQKLLDLLSSSSIIDNFESNLDLADENE